MSAGEDSCTDFRESFRDTRGGRSGANGFAGMASGPESVSHKFICGSSFRRPPQVRGKLKAETVPAIFAIRPFREATARGMERAEPHRPLREGLYAFVHFVRGSRPKGMCGGLARKRPLRDAVKNTARKYGCFSRARAGASIRAVRFGMISAARRRADRNSDSSEVLPFPYRFLQSPFCIIHRHHGQQHWRREDGGRAHLFKRLKPGNGEIFYKRLFLHPAFRERKCLSARKKNAPNRLTMRLTR